jgi:GNAT superfamily N-acetyltransferase
MTDVRILAATAARFDDVERALTGGGDGGSCQCQWWRLTSAAFERASREEREGMLRDETAASVPPGLVAYVDGEPAGWVRVGPRTGQPRLSRTRDFAGTPEPWDAEDVWAVTCFAVRREHRGGGLMARLLDAAVAFAFEHGARAIDGYPYDTAAASQRANQLYRGVLGVFLAAGFHEVARPQPDRVIVLHRR